MYKAGRQQDIVYYYKWIEGFVHGKILKPTTFCISFFNDIYCVPDKLVCC